MIRVENASSEAVDRIARRAAERDARVEASVRSILEDVRARGDRALYEYALRFDRASLRSIAVSREEIESAHRSVDPELMASLRLAASNIERFHRAQIREGFSCALPDGSLVGQRVLPMDRVGVYIPGGTASYPSSALMNAIPARLAGVPEIVAATPPGEDGSIPPPVLAALRLAGATEVYKVGGAQAIAALAYGTESIRRVDKIVGPGNAYVNCAKKLVYGAVGIDMPAGPSEVVIVADSTVDARFVASDLLSQAEHDPSAIAILIAVDAGSAEAVRRELERQLDGLPREGIARRAIDGGGAILVADCVESAIELANRFAPEHLELCVADPLALLDRVRNAASVFLGPYAPVALGDYLAGPNHTLPTGGAARFASPLGVDDFARRSSYVYYSKAAFYSASADIARIARGEGLEAHARSALIRAEGEG